VLFGCLSFVAKSQTEFMLHGTLKIYKGRVDSVTIVVESERKQYGRVVKPDSTGEFRIWLAYARDYVVKFSRPGYQTVMFAVSTKMPEGVKHCCFTPFDMSFHLFKPDGKSDTLFRRPIVKIKYEARLKTYNYSLDIDYYIQKMIVQAEIDKQQRVKDEASRSRMRDSLEMERKYLSLINSGNSYYVNQQFALSRQMFEKALELKPSRKYPAYKLEDIKTELEIFNKKIDSLPPDHDSIVAAVMRPKPEPKPVLTYRRKTPQELEAMFRKDLQKQIVKETRDPRELQQRLAFVSQVLDKKKPEPVAAAQPVSLAPEVPVAVKPRPIVVLPEPPPAKDSIPNFDNEAYQDSLKNKYPDERTIERTTEEYKTTTRVIINRDNKVAVYLKVEHKWGATFYFIDNTPFPMENISKSFFEVSTRLLSERDVAPAQQDSLFHGDQ